MKKKNIILTNRILRFIFSLLIPILFLCFWQYAAVNGMVKETVMPRPTKIGSTLLSMIQNGKLQENIYVSMRRVITGYLIGVSTAIVIGIIIGLFDYINAALELVMGLLRPIPNIAWVPMLILWTGIGEESKIIVIAIATFWPVLLNTVDGIRNVDKKYLEVANIFKKSKFHTIVKVVLPSALPYVFTGLRIASGNALMGVIGAEMFAASAGIGYMVSYGREMSKPAVMFGGVFIISILGWLLNMVVTKLEHKVQR